LALNFRTVSSAGIIVVNHQAWVSFTFIKEIAVLYKSIASTLWKLIMFVIDVFGFHGLSAL
jgi:hypothetical protein